MVLAAADTGTKDPMTILVILIFFGALFLVLAAYTGIIWFIKRGKTIDKLGIIYNVPPSIAIGVAVIILGTQPSLTKGLFMGATSLVIMMFTLGFLSRYCEPPVAVGKTATLMFAGLGASIIVCSILASLVATL